MSEITIQDIDNEFDKFCRNNKCETCYYTSCDNCKTAFINERYDVEIKKKDPFDVIKKDAVEMREDFFTFCNKSKHCDDCVLNGVNCQFMYALAKERGIL